MLEYSVVNNGKIEPLKSKWGEFTPLWFKMNLGKSQQNLKPQIVYQYSL